MQDDLKDYVLSKKDLLEIFPFGKTKLQILLNNNKLPVVKIGRQYLTTKELIDKWFDKYKGKEIIYKN